jgi:serine/threonine-protein kinase SRK2
MGCGASAPAVEEKRAPATPSRPQPVQRKEPCLGLCDTHELVRELGKGEHALICPATSFNFPTAIWPGFCRGKADHESCTPGGTGEAYLYKDKERGEMVAIKLIRRPLPKVIQPNILREIMVRLPFFTRPSFSIL